MKRLLWALAIVTSFLLIVYYGGRHFIFNLPTISSSRSIYPYALEIIKPNGEVETVMGQSSGKKVDEIIKDLGQEYYLEDKIQAFPNIEYSIGAKIKVIRAPEITVTDGKRKTLYRSFAKTVDELFREKNIEIGDQDQINFALTTNLTLDMTIKIVRVAITNVTEVQAINFKTITKDDPNLDYGKKRVVSGAKGEKRLVYLVKREDGIEVSRKLISSEITKQPSDQIEYIGKKVTVLSSVSGIATIGPKNCNIVSATYRKGTLVRITNISNKSRNQIFGIVDCTWGLATAPAGVVLDLSSANLSSLKWNGEGAGPKVLVEEIRQ